VLVTVAVSLLWGAAATWTAVNRTSAANDMVSTTGPLSFYSQQVYRSLSDADATEATAFLAVTAPPGASAEFHTDIARAGGYLRAATAADSSPATGPDLTALATGIPEYTMLIGRAEADSRAGLPVGASYLQEASYLMRTQLLPAADDLYRQQNARLARSQAKATGLPVAAMAAAVICAIALFRVQRRLAAATHRVLNRGLVAASLVGVLSLAWLLGSFLVARASLVAAHDHGTAAAQSLVQAEIAVLRARADESLTLINRSGDDASEADFRQAARQLGPGGGTLLSAALAAGGGSPGYGQAAAAGSAATAWYAVHRAVRGLDNDGDYPDAVYLAIGSGTSSPAVIQQREAALATQLGPRHPATSAAAFGAVDADLTGAISADQASFTASASSGDTALGGLAAGMAIASLLMTAGCAWGLSRRIAEYR
jgi:hypothetical protein